MLRKCLVYLAISSEPVLLDHLGGMFAASGRTGHTASSSFLRLTNRFTRAQVTNSRCAFFFSPR